jgi:hypothetical protein
MDTADLHDFAWDSIFAVASNASSDAKLHSWAIALKWSPGDTNNSMSAIRRTIMP